jgi:hypothetical protein
MKNMSNTADEPLPAYAAKKITVRPACPADVIYAAAISEEMESSAKARGTGIARRPPALIREKILHGQAVIAVTGNGDWAGFSYLQTWERETFVSNSGLIVRPLFREKGIAAKIKRCIFQLSRRLYPAARVFSITTSAAVMKLNSRLGFEPVAYASLPQDPAFWNGCRSCANYRTLRAKQRRFCCCTALLFTPSQSPA